MILGKINNWNKDIQSHAQDQDQNLKEVNN